MTMKNKHVLVTGGAGFIGSHLVDKLMLEGAHVTVLDNLTNGKIGNIAHHMQNFNFRFMRGSVVDPFDVEKAMDGVQVVFHLACLGVRHSIKHPFENHRVNSEGTLLVLEAARNHHVERFVYCSSSEVYGTAIQAPIGETHPTLPCTVYGASKLAGEAYARSYFRAYALPTVIIRPFNTYGPRSHHERDAGELIPKAIVRGLNRRNILIFGDGSQTRDFTYVEDTAKGLLVAAEYPEAVGQTFNIGSAFEISVHDVGKKILKLINDPQLTLEQTPGRPGDVLRLLADASKFSEMTQWKPKVDFDTGLQKTIQWFRSVPNARALVEEEEAFNWM